MSTRPSLAGRAVAAVGLTVGFYVIALAIAGSLILVAVAQAQSGQAIGARIIGLSLLGAITILAAITPRRDRFVPPGPQLHPAEQPRLFDMITEVAQATDQRAPAEVYLVADVDAGVTRRGGFLGLGSRRVMVIGLGLLQSLTVTEVRAVLAHEYGHYHGGDTKLGPWIYKTREAIGRTLISLTEHRLLRIPFALYGGLFLRITQDISRRQELLADELAARSFGSRAVIDGLQTAHGHAFAFDMYWLTEVVPVLSAGFRPPLAQGFAMFASAERMAVLLVGVVERELEDEEQDPFDSHPSLRDRVAAAKRFPPGDDPGGGDRAISLLDDEDDLEVELVSSLTGASPERNLPPLPWEEVGGRVLVPGWQRRLWGDRSALRGKTPLDLPELAKDTSALVMTLPSSREDPPPADDQSRLGSFVLGAAFAVALVGEGWGIQASPGEEPSLHRGGTIIRPFDVIDELESGGIQAETWQRRCKESGFAHVDLGDIHKPEE